METIRKLEPGEWAVVEKWIQRRDNAEEVLADLAATLAGGADPSVRLLVDAEGARLVRVEPDEDRIRRGVGEMTGNGSPRVKIEQGG